MRPLLSPTFSVDFSFPKDSRIRSVSVKILCTADIHIGRRPSRLPGRVDTGPLSCAKAWTAITEKAIAERVDLVAIAGDLVDEANRFYEAAGPVEAGVRALSRHGIRTVAVAGNHDHDTLAWIAQGLDPEDFTLLGRGGQWERVTIEKDGAPILHVDGWSFPAAIHREDPLAEYPRAPGGDVPVLGLIHGDLDSSGSRHAPLALAGLRSQPVGFWLLGHVHKPALHGQAGVPGVLYPGSPLAMDPGETGAHGVWLVEVDAGGRFFARPHPLSLVRYETLEVDVTGVSEAGELDRKVADAVAAELARVEENCGPLRYLSLRVRLVGRTSLHRSLQTRGLESASELESRRGSLAGLVERVEIATRPERDLEALSRGRDAAGVLARLVRNLERGELSEEETRLVHVALSRMTEVRGAAPYLRLPQEDTPGVEDAAGILGSQALLLLDELVAQKETA